MTENFDTVEEFLERVGRPVFQHETGYSTQLVQRAKDTGLFPAHWFWKVRSFCADRDVSVPEHLFRGHPEARQSLTSITPSISVSAPTDGTEFGIHQGMDHSDG